MAIAMLTNFNRRINLYLIFALSSSTHLIYVFLLFSSNVLYRQIKQWYSQPHTHDWLVIVHVHAAINNPPLVILLYHSQLIVLLMQTVLCRMYELQLHFE